MPGRFRSFLPRKRSSTAVLGGSANSDGATSADGLYTSLHSPVISPLPFSAGPRDGVFPREDLHQRSQSCPPAVLGPNTALPSLGASTTPKSQEKKILVLGASQAGKSTLMKQWRLLYAPREEVKYMRVTYRIAIYLDLIDLINICLVNAEKTRDPQAAALRKLRLTPVFGLADKLEKSLATRHSTTIDLVSGGRGAKAEVAPFIFAAMFSEISRLFEDAFVTYVPTNYQSYLVTRLPQICSHAYTPDDQDVLQVQLDTIGIEECRFRLSPELHLNFCDVSGSKGHRQVWSRYFEDAASIIFVIDASSFDKATSKGPNQLEESLRLLSKVCRNPLLKKVEISVYLNKCDLLKKKIRGGANLNRYFGDYYRQSGSYQAALEYLRKRIQCIALEDRPNTALASHLSRKQITVQVIQATDAKQVVLAMENLRDSLVSEGV